MEKLRATHILRKVVSLSCFALSLLIFIFTIGLALMWVIVEPL